MARKKRKEKEKRKKKEEEEEEEELEDLKVIILSKITRHMHENVTERGRT